MKIHRCYHCHSLILEHFIFPLAVTPCPPCLAPGNHYFTICLLRICLFWTFHLKQNHTIYPAFVPGFFTKCKFQVHPCYSIYQYFVPFNYQIIFHYIDTPHFAFLIHCLDLGLFLPLTIMNNATVNITVQVFVWMCVFISLGYIPRNGLARSYDNSF